MWGKRGKRGKHRAGVPRQLSLGLLEDGMGRAEQQQEEEGSGGGGRGRRAGRAGDGGALPWISAAAGHAPGGGGSGAR